MTETDFMKETIEAKCLHQAMVLVLAKVGQQGILKRFSVFYREHCTCVISLAS